MQLEVKIRNRLTHKALLILVVTGIILVVLEALYGIKSFVYTSGFDSCWYLLRPLIAHIFMPSMKMYGLYLLDTDSILYHQCMFQRNMLGVTDLYTNLHM